MAGTAITSGSLQVTANTAVANLAASASYTMTGEDFVNQTQYVGTSYTAIDLGTLGSVGPVLIKVLTGSGTQKLDLAVDVAGTKYQFSQVPEGDFVKLMNPTNTLYAKATTGTLGFQFMAAEQ